MEFGKGCLKLSPGPSSHANICRLSLVAWTAGVEENSLLRHDEQCVNIEGEEERDAMVKADRGAIFASREDQEF